MRPRSLQSENGVERSSLERQPLLETLRGARLGRRSSQLIPRNQDHVHRGARRSAASFTNEAGNVPCRDATVVATLHHRRRRPTVVAAFVSGRGARMTPELAEQRRFGRARKRQHDRKESCSKHVMLAIPRGKSCASQKGRRSLNILTFSAARHRRTEGPAEFRWSVLKIPHCESVAPGV